MDAPSAVFSPDRTFRYRLVRRTPWTNSRIFNVIGLNPSTADETRNDPTVSRCMGFAYRWGCGLLVVTNLFAFRATRPERLRQAADPIGPDNDRHLVEVARGASRVLAAWGAAGSYRHRGQDVEGIMRDCGFKLECLGITKAGAPRHPLYVPADVEPVPLVAS